MAQTSAAAFPSLAATELDLRSFRKMTSAQDACQRVLNLALDAVEESARSGEAIAAHVVAVRLLDDNPECPMSWEDLRDHIVELANARGAIVSAHYGA